jgi:hypothetical protein
MAEFWKTEQYFYSLSVSDYAFIDREWTFGTKLNL